MRQTSSGLKESMRHFIKKVLPDALPPVMPMMKGGFSWGIIFLFLISYQLQRYISDFDIVYDRVVSN